eukprot:CAMPEP_0174273904 /NCGR_PEP_ID=MMETSP0439-20130205/56191_1 /TAXON_ID=0 /ORGANISM="Stereomyxa ramosa, Strain Chinc5" /LENGTH=351 /DNA_ID=CAMNT_0015365373 /DNA_START=75 /DNA_END=1127 /DNA_ORIENTATION=-
MLTKQGIRKFVSKVTEEKEESIPSHLLLVGFEEQKFSDVTVQILGKKYYLHKIVLSRIPYFASMLSPEWLKTEKEGEDDDGIMEVSITSDDVYEVESNPECIDIVFRAIYGAPIHLHISKVFTLLSLAYYFVFSELKTQCVEFIKSELSGDIILTALQISFLHDNRTLFESCFTWLLCYVTDLPTQTLGQLHCCYVKELIKSDRLFVANEFCRYELILKYIAARESIGETKLSEEEEIELYSSVRPHHMKIQELLLARSHSKVPFSVIEEGSLFQVVCGAENWSSFPGLPESWSKINNKDCPLFARFGVRIDLQNIPQSGDSYGYPASFSVAGFPFELMLQCEKRDKFKGW